MKTLTIWYLSFFAIMICSTDYYCQSDKSEIANLILNDIHLEQVSLPIAAHRIASKYQVPIGIEYADSELTDDIKVSLKGGKSSPLNVVLNALVEQNPNYKWEIKDGVVNFTPTKSRSKFLEKLLDTKIDVFYPDRNLNRVSLLDFIMKLPFVREVFQEHNAYPLIIGEPRVMKVDLPENVYVQVNNTNVRSILNSLIKKSDYKFWMMHSYTVEGEELAVSIKF